VRAEWVLNSAGLLVHVGSSREDEPAEPLGNGRPIGRRAFTVDNEISQWLDMIA